MPDRFVGSRLVRSSEGPWVSVVLFIVEESEDHDAPDNRGNATSMVSLGVGGTRCRRRQSGRETPLRRPPLELQQTGAARREHLGRATRLH